MNLYVVKSYLASGMWYFLTLISYQDFVDKQDGQSTYINDKSELINREDWVQSNGSGFQILKTTDGSIAILELKNNLYNGLQLFYDSKNCWILDGYKRSSFASRLESDKLGNFIFLSINAEKTTKITSDPCGTLISIEHFMSNSGNDEAFLINGLFFGKNGYLVGKVLNGSGIKSTMRDDCRVSEFYESGLKEKEVIVWKDGSSVTSLFEDGLKSGQEIKVYCNNKVEYIADYKLGVLDGILLKFSKDGRIISDERYLNGNKVL